MPPSNPSPWGQGVCEQKDAPGQDGWFQQALIDRLPLVAFLAIYVPTCYVGAIVLLLQGWARSYLPALTGRDIVVVLVLLHIGPIILWIAAEGGLRLVRPRWSAHRVPRPAAALTPLAAWLVFLIALTIAGWSLYRADAWALLPGWSSHHVYLAARWQLMGRLRFFEFVNLYTVLPVAGAYVMLVQRRGWATALVALLIGLAQYPLAQRRVLLTSAILIGFALYVHYCVDREGNDGVRPGWPVWGLVGGGVAAYALFIVLTLQWGTLDFASLGLLRRYGVPAILYPLVFPRVLPYYHLDIGLDILGIGSMPDDSIQVQKVFAPWSSNQTISAPFQFVLYSQGGVLVALLGSAVVGALLGATWAAVVGARPSATRSLLGAIVVTFGAFLAMDSVRNSVIVSYGLAWGALLVAILHGMARVQLVASGRPG